MVDEANSDLASGETPNESRPSSSIEGDMVPLSPHKKHKKHKHKKHKRKRDLDEGLGSFEFLDTFESGKPSLKLKIKIGGQMLGEKSVSKLEIADDSSDDSHNKDSLVLDRDNVAEGLEGEEEEDAWLDALESGRLEEVDAELRTMKDPALMTARQRALHESKNMKEKEEPIPLVTETVDKELTEEMIQRKILRAKKRKELADEKREKDKKQTLERLLKKPDSKAAKVTKKVPVKKAPVPKVTYVNNTKGISLSYPTGFNFPLRPQVAPKVPNILRCGVGGCTNVKRYSCSKTQIPLCSLSCYKALHAIS